MKSTIVLTMALAACLTAAADVVTVGSGSYTTSFPGTDAAGRNGYPTGSPLVSGNAATRPIPSNDWWSSKLVNPFPNNMFNYPLGIKTTSTGLVLIKPIVDQALPELTPMTVGIEGLTSDAPTVSDYTDWTVTFSWENSVGRMDAIAGVGMPMVYCSTTASAPLTVKVEMGTASVNGNILVVSGSFNNASYAVYAPTGCTWNASGSTYTCSLGQKKYWTVALLPDNAGNAATKAEQWSAYAFAFPANTRAEWSYNPSAGIVTTRYSVTVNPRETGANTALVGLLPHHKAHLASDIPFSGDSYATVRGELSMAVGNEFTTSIPFAGILPTLPAVTSDASGYSAAELQRLVDGVIADSGLQDWTDSYNDGQLLNRLVQTARVAREGGYTQGYQQLRSLIKQRLERWLQYTPGDVAFLFYYYAPWGTMLGYPAGHGQDSNLNDHHFHWGYLIHAAAFLAEDDPTWVDRWGGMIDLLIRDAASTDRSDSMFPYQRAFSPYAGHCWANGTATAGPGNDQESTSEAMQFHSSLIHWGQVTGNTAVRDLGVYMYATERSAVEQYWFDIDDTNFASGYSYPVASRVFTNGYDIQNYWGGGIQGSYGIELYPVHSGSMYLVNNKAWARRFKDAIIADTPLLSSTTDANTWHDVFWQFIAMLDPTEALRQYNAMPERNIKFGISKAQTYQWLHAMAQYGTPAQSVTADYPLAVAFNRDDVRTYAVCNYSTSPFTVKYSDGFTMTAAPQAITTSTGVNPDPVDPEDPGSDPGTDPDDPGTDPDDPGNDPGTTPDTPCTVTSSSSTQGNFAGEYTITSSTTADDKVAITAIFTGDYVGLAAAYVWDETTGFTEINMTQDSPNSFSAIITPAADVVKYRIKIAFAGGMAVTIPVEYAVGTICSATDIVIIPEAMIQLYPVPATDSFTIAVPYDDVELSLYSSAGQKVLTGSFSHSGTFAVGHLPRGLYFCRLEAADGATAVVTLPLR